MDEAFEAARARHRAGDLAGAAEAYTRVAAADPGHFRALSNLGSVREALGQAGPAEEAYRAALAAAPDEALIHYNLGRLLQLQGRTAEAEACYRRAIALAPGMADAHFNLGRLLLERGDAPDAEGVLREAARLAPDAAGPQSFLGDALFAQLRLVEALERYRAVAALDPRDAAAAFDEGKTLESLRRHAEAVACYRRSVALDPGGIAAREGLVRALDAAGHRDEALAELAAWRAAAPEEPVADHLLAALGGAPAPARAPDAYVRAAFDRFAGDFDATLTRLGYAAPQLVAAAVALCCGEPRGALDVLDAGCGTGLCAPLLRPWARRLEGVDLSPAMLARARARGGYDALVEGELTAYLGAGGAGAWDLIVAADTLIYFGPLDAVLAAAARALRPGGAMVFTLERLDGDRFALTRSGRYAHSQAYARAAAAGAGLTPTVIHGTLRHEGGAPVPGLIVAARRPAAQA